MQIKYYLLTTKSTDGWVTQVSEHINHFWRSRGKEIWSQIQYNGTKWEPPLQTLEKQQKKARNASILLLWCYPTEPKAQHSNDPKVLIYATFLSLNMLFWYTLLLATLFITSREFMDIHEC